MADMNKAEKLAAARRKLKEYQKKNKDATTKTDYLKRAPKSTSNSGTKGPYEQSFVFDSGTGESSPNEPVSSSPVPAVPEPALSSNGYYSPASLPPSTNESLFTSVLDARDFFDNLPSHSAQVPAVENVQEEEIKEQEPVGEAPNDAVVTSEMPECDISQVDQRAPAGNIPNPRSMPEDNLISSSTESLRQLSLQMNGLIDESVDTAGNSNSELERRNQELAALLADREQKIEQFQLQLKEYQSRTSQLGVDMSQLQAEMEMRLARELLPVQEQLQLHIQTVGILVGEKTELQSALGKSQQTAKQKAAEVEELQGRLKASRHRVMELEKELSALGGTREKLESGSAEQAKELERVKLENADLKRQLEEVEQDASEVRQKLITKSIECAALQQEVQKRQSQIDLLQLKVQQLTTTERPDVDQLLEAMHQQKIGLEWQVSELQQTVKSLGVDREQATQQYQDYLQQFNSQLKNMAEKLAATSAENEQLTNREQSLVRHISELEKQLQQQRNREEPRDTEQVRELENAITTLQVENRELTARLDAQLQEKSGLLGNLEEASRKFKELEGRMEALQADQPDTVRLLAAMESDKVAAAQAVGQNQKLKTQLEELQDSFVKMSNDKMELTEHLQHEQHVNKELGERLGQQEGELLEMRGQLELKDKLLLELQNRSYTLSDQVSTYSDHMKQFEEQEELLEGLRKELDQAKVHIEMLTAQNKELQAIPALQTDRRDDMLASLLASVRQLELERDQLQLELQQAKHHADAHVLSHPDIDSKTYISMKEAMEKLEERYTKTMKEAAEILDEKERLEHIVLQLQGETETIGEYIALYQAQRSMLRQRALEKDEQLKRLQRDREEMKMKLNELTNLVQTLVANKEDQHITQGLVNGDVALKIAVPEEPEVPSTNQAADKIMALLSEIGSSNLVEPQSRGMESFHPCPWCSGRLITV